MWGWIKGTLGLSILGVVLVLGGRAGWYGKSTIDFLPLDLGQRVDGVVYFLPRSVLDIEVTYRILKCEVASAEGDRMTGFVAATAVPALKVLSEPDFARGYYVSRASTSGVFWNTDLAIQTAGGLIRSVNATVKSEAKPPEAANLGAVVQLAIDQVLEKKQSAGPAKPSPVQIRSEVCGDALIEALKAAKEPVTGATNTAADPTLLRRNLRIVPGLGCPLGMQAVRTATDDRQTCRLDGRDTVGSLLMDQARFSPSALQGYTIEIDIAPINRVGALPPDGQMKSLVYRTPGLARIAVCMPECPKGRILLEQTVPVSQYGPEAVISIERRLFSDRSSKLEFGDQGELVSATFRDAESASK